MGIYTSLVLDEWVEKAFYHALRTNGFVILAGLTGTGKTRLFKEFEVYEDEFICLLRRCRYGERSIWEYIMSLRNWIVDRFRNREDFGINDYFALRGENVHETFAGKLKGVGENNRWIAEVIYGNNSDLTVNNMDFRFRGYDRFYLDASLQRNYQEYIDTDEYSSRHRDYALDDEDRFFEDVFRNVLHEISLNISNENTEFFLDDDSELSTFFTPKVCRLLAFLSNPYKYRSIYNESTINDIIHRLRQRLEEESLVCNEESSQVVKCFFPIRPDFTEPSHIVGYLNPIDGRYYPTEVVNFILEAIRNYLLHGRGAIPYLILFDEMNIAQVEYYFADFLSVLESPRIEDPRECEGKIREFMRTFRIEYDLEKFRGFTSEGITLYTVSRTVKILLPPNLYFIGTVNIDETTRSFSPKVLDRAFVIEFDSDLRQFIREYGRRIRPNCRLLKYDFTRGGDFYIPDRKRIANFVATRLNDDNDDHIVFKVYEILKEYNLHFGYRTVEHITMFIVNSRNTCHGELRMSETEAIDVAIYTKILPKLWGSRTKLEASLKKLLCLLCMDVSKAQGDGQWDRGQFVFEEETLKWRRYEENVENVEGNVTEEEVAIVDVARIMNGVVEFGNFRINTNYPLAVRKILEMLYRLEVEGFCSFM